MVFPFNLLTKRYYFVKFTLSVTTMCNKECRCVYSKQILKCYINFFIILSNISYMLDYFRSSQSMPA